MLVIALILISLFVGASLLLAYVGARAAYKRQADADAALAELWNSRQPSDNLVLAPPSPPVTEAAELAAPTAQTDGAQGKRDRIWAGMTRDQYITDRCRRASGKGRDPARVAAKAARQFEMIDTNHDGILDWCEWVAWRAVRTVRANRMRA
jgi:hypothetical protein